MTTKDTNDRLNQQDSLTLSEGSNSDAKTTVNINLESTFQNILGFGGAMTQSSATVFKQIPEDLQNALLDSYYGENGIGYTTGRLPIHSCDFSVDTYTFDDVEGDYDLENFDTTVAYDANLSIPMITAALERNPHLKLFGSPWSPPAWMKDNNNMLYGGSLLPDAAASWATYFSKWIDAYTNQGINIWGVTVQNEPEAAQPWESCVYSAQQEADFVSDYLGPTLRSDWPDVKIFGYDHNKDHLGEWADTLLSADSPSSEYVDGIAFHWYAGNCFENVAQVHEDYPDKMLLPSEACYELTQLDDDEAGDVWLANGTWSRGEGYAHDILGDLRSGSVGWTDWNILLNQEGGPNHVNNFCDAPVLADLRDDSNIQLYFHPQYYYIGHFSKFLLPDSTRVDVSLDGDLYKDDDGGDDCSGWPAYGTCGSGGLQSVAFVRPDGLLSVVLMNCGEDTIEDIAINLAGTAGGDMTVATSIPAHSIQTYLIPV
jgi:glucosylceramidase